MDFVRSHFRKMQLWPVEHFLPQKKWGKSRSELHFSKLTFFKIHVLVIFQRTFFGTTNTLRNFLFFENSWHNLALNSIKINHYLSIRWTFFIFWICDKSWLIWMLTWIQLNFNNHYNIKKLAQNRIAYVLSKVLTIY